MSQGGAPSAQELERLWVYMTPAERAEMDRLLSSSVLPPWQPQKGPQTMAYICPATELFYGGAAGGGKTDLLLGLGGTQHRASLVMRRTFPRTRALIERSREIYGAGLAHNRDSFNEQLHLWRLRWDGVERTIEFGSCQYEKDKENYKGRPHDLKAWDELPDFLESQYRYVNGWLRSVIPGQRCRIVATGNPPTTQEGMWVRRRWRAWLDKGYPNRAKSGEVRWFAEVDGQDVEVESGAPFLHKDKLGHEETIIPLSRCFIAARLEDNPILADTGYRAQVMGYPEPIRSMMLYGFEAEVDLSEDPWQVIPTTWVKLARARWRATPRPDLPLSAMGVDCARGGSAKHVQAKKYGDWFAPLVKVPGAEVPDGPTAAARVLADLDAGDAVVNVDVVGIGASVYDHLMPKCNVVGTNWGEHTDATDLTGRLQFANKRARDWWRMREALDPSNARLVCLPDDDELEADLTAPRWEMRAGKIAIEEKREIIERIGRSPDCADAVVLAEAISPQTSPDAWLAAYANDDNGGKIRTEVYPRQNWVGGTPLNVSIPPEPTRLG